MKLISNTWLRSLCVMALLALFASASFGQQGRASLRGVVADEFGASIVGATVTLMDASGTAKTATTNSEGVYTFTNLAAGKYTVIAVATGFALSDGTEVEIAAGQRDAVFRVAEAFSENGKGFVGFEFRIAFGQGENRVA